MIIEEWEIVEWILEPCCEEAMVIICCSRSQGKCKFLVLWILYYLVGTVYPWATHFHSCNINPKYTLVCAESIGTFHVAYDLSTSI